MFPPDFNWLEILNSVLFAIRASKHSFNKNTSIQNPYMDESQSCQLKWNMKSKKGNPIDLSVQAMGEEWEERNVEDKIEPAFYQAKRFGRHSWKYKEISANAK